MAGEPPTGEVVRDLAKRPNSVALSGMSIASLDVTQAEINALAELVARVVHVMRSHPDVPNTFGEPGPVIWLKDFPSGS
jgi:hypothetical protein